MNKKEALNLIQVKMKGCSRPQHLAYMFAVEDINECGLEKWITSPATEFTSSFEESLVDFSESLISKIYEDERVSASIEDDLGLKTNSDTLDMMQSYTHMCAEVVKAVAEYLDIRNEITVKFYSA
jgi:hypothetical protein